MKRVFAMLLTLALVCAMTAAVPASADTYYVASKNGGNLNLRQDPSQGSKSLGSILYGTKLEISEVSADGKWGRTTYNKRDGWVMLSYLSPSTPDPANSKAAKAQSNVAMMDTEFKQMDSAPLAETYQVVVAGKAGEAYHLRWAPYYSAYAMRSDVRNGEVFTVLARGVHWLQVVDNQSGRVAYLTQDIAAPYTGDAQ